MGMGKVAMYYKGYTYSVMYVVYTCNVIYAR